AEAQALLGVVEDAAVGGAVAAGVRHVHASQDAVPGDARGNDVGRVVVVEDPAVGVQVRGRCRRQDPYDVAVHGAAHQLGVAAVVDRGPVPVVVARGVEELVGVDVDPDQLEVVVVVDARALPAGAALADALGHGDVEELDRVGGVETGTLDVAAGGAVAVVVGDGAVPHVHALARDVDSAAVGAGHRVEVHVSVVHGEPAALAVETAAVAGRVPL